MKLLQGQTILVTRDTSQSGDFKNKLEAAGAKVLCIPTIAIGDPPDWSSFDAAAEKAGQFDWIVFTSTNAVKQTRKRLAILKINSLDVFHLKTAVIGDQTAEEAKKAGWKVELLPERNQSENLLAEFLKSNLIDKKIWIPGALEARDLLSEGLRQAGAEVIQTPVYQTIVPLENQLELKAAVASRKIDWITFTSPSTVRNFFQMLKVVLPQEQLPKLASIGAITTKAISEFSLSPMFTADPQNMEGLLAGILENESQKKE